MKLAFRAAWSRVAGRSARRLLSLIEPVPGASVSWERCCGPFFGSQVAMLEIRGRRAEMVLHRAAARDDPAELREVTRLVLA
jgi:hypothetical protein